MCRLNSAETVGTTVKSAFVVVGGNMHENPVKIKANLRNFPLLTSPFFRIFAS